MISEINHDIILLQKTSEPATEKDLWVAKNLLETLQAHEDRCVGMAANMIGVFKRIIAFVDIETGSHWVMLNPEIIKTSKETYLAQEQCLSISGIRQTRRYRRIKVRYQDEHMNIKIKTFHDRTAQIIQHEVDHFEGIII